MKNMIVHMIGNAHLDPVWLWNWQAGADEALATMRAAVNLCEEYPDFIYTRGEAWVYETVEKLDPSLFDRIRKLIEAGRWKIAGGHYLQPDANLPTEVGWHRQIEIGQEYFSSRFGLRPKAGYNVDTFGHPATLPDILAQHGYQGYVFHRPSPVQMSLPAQTFRWQGTGGAEILGFRIIPSYVTRVDDLYGQIMLSAEAANPGLNHTMCFYGLGNHGGGPNKATVEYIIKNRLSFPGLELRFSSVEAFFEAASAERESLPVVRDELQYTFPGCYSVMHDIKQAQHRGEYLMEQAEQIAEHFEPDDATKSSHAMRLHDGWKDLIFTQFHDILSGTSISSAWESVRAMQGRARITAEEVILQSTRRWAADLGPVSHQQIVAINASEDSYNDFLTMEPFIDFDDWGGRWLADEKGCPVPYQLIAPYENIGKMTHRIVFPARLPAKGSRRFQLRDDALPEKTLKMPSDLNADRRGISNRYLEIKVGKNGISGVVFSGQPLLKQLTFHLRQDWCDTWGFQQNSFPEPVLETLSDCKWVVEESGPIRARLFTETFLGNSRIQLCLTVHADDPRFYLSVSVNYSERHCLLQMPVKMSGTTTRWRCGLAGGAVDRKPGPHEWPVQSWALLGNSTNSLGMTTPDAYSLSVNKTGWQWTLLRSPYMAWAGDRSVRPGSMAHHTDQGTHTFEFIFHCGKNLSDSALVSEARKQVQPPVLFDHYQGMNRPAWGNYPPRRLWTGDIVRARDDGKMMHLEDTGGFNFDNNH